MSRITSCVFGLLLLLYVTEEIVSCVNSFDLFELSENESDDSDPDIKLDFDQLIDFTTTSFSEISIDYLNELIHLPRINIGQVILKPTKPPYNPPDLA